MDTHLLVPVDGSAASDRGLQEAVKWARLTGARLRPMHVVNNLVNATAMKGLGTVTADLIALGSHPVRGAMRTHSPAVHPWLEVGLAVVLAVGLAAAPVSAAPATIYRWTDEHGKTHYTEQVPEKHLKTARPVATGSAEPTVAQQREAQERAASQQRLAAAIDSAASKARSTPRPSPAASTPLAKRPAQVPNERTDCSTWARLYQESLDCFGPYRTTRGATRVEAFTFCTAVDEPPSRCRQDLPNESSRGAK